MTTATAPIGTRRYPQAPVPDVGCVVVGGVSDQGDPLASVLAMAGAGDRAAFAALHASAQPRVFGLARRLLRDEGHAQDVTQEVFWQIWRTAGTFDASRGSGWGWILMITHARAVDRIRAITAQQRRDRDAAHTRPDHDCGHDQVIEVVIRAVEHAQVRAGLAALTPLQRQSVELHYFAERSFGQISEQLNVPIATIKTRIRDGLIRLRAAVAEPARAAG